MNLLMVQRYGENQHIPRIIAISSPTTCDNLLNPRQNAGKVPFSVVNDDVLPCALYEKCPPKRAYRIKSFGI